MSLVNRLLPSILVAFLALGSLAVLAPPAAAQPAPLPTLVQGHAVGYGASLDLTTLAAPLLTQLQSNYASFGLTAAPKVAFTGTFDEWVYQVVQSATSSKYTLGTQSATGSKIHLAFNGTFGGILQPGTYGGPCPNYPSPRYGPGSVEIDLDLTMLSTSTSTSNYTVSTVALMDQSDNVALQLSAHAVLKGFPLSSYNVTTCTEVVTSANFDLTLSVDTKDQLHESFNPPLDLYNFPINDGENWWAYTNASLTGNLAGTINVQGLSAADTQSFFDNLTKALVNSGLGVSGLTGFPIDLTKITLTYGAVNLLKGGVLSNLPPFPLAQRLMARQSTMVLADGNSHEVFLIAPYQNTTYSCPPTAYEVYSPSDGMIVAVVVYPDCNLTNLPIFNLQPVPAGTAQNNIGNTEQKYVVFPPTTNALADFFFAAPYYGLILIAAVIVVLVYLIVRMRRKRAMAPPQMPPQAPPPPPGPP